MLLEDWPYWYGIPLVICLVSSAVFYKMSHWVDDDDFVTASGVALGLGLVPLFNIFIVVALVSILSALGGTFVVTTLIRVLEKR